MATSEQLGFSLREERRGVHALIWDDIGDLYRVLLVTVAGLGEQRVQPLLISREHERLQDDG
jgi:hypothetical protein